MTKTFLPEWCEQDAVLLAWPHQNTDWQSVLPDIHQAYIALITAITRFQYVVLLVHDEHVHVHAQTLIQNHQIDINKILFVRAPYNDTWLRDTGPLATRTEQDIQLHDFRFNGWGGKFEAKLDDQLCARLFEQPIFTKHAQKHDLILEGGSVDTNGSGVLLTTQRCLLSKSRNPSMTKDSYAELFKKYFNISQIHWLKHGEIQGDDTDGHIDMLARFCSNDTIAYSSCTDPNDEHFAPLKQLKTELTGLQQQNGEPYRLIALELPKAIVENGDHRLPASYANFLIINQAVLVPVYDDPMDEKNCENLAQCFPDREIIPINAKPIIRQGGSLHCLTMQLPAGSLSGLGGNN